MTKPKSKGVCLYCGGTYPKASIHRHVATHLLQKTLDGKLGKSFLLKVEQNPKWGVGYYFLSLWVDGNATLNTLDDFLRGIWLECCGHMCSFTNAAARQTRGNMWDFFEAEELLSEGKTKEYEKMMEDTRGEIPQGRKIALALAKGMKINYKYDFGSSTELQITVLEQYPVKADAEVVLLSRNEPLEILCQTCGIEPAIAICTAHGYEEPNLFCKVCAKKHGKTCPDFSDYAKMPVVNSPRMGVCAYEGGSIDTKRDGVFVKIVA